jgi:hypothetical protein
VDARVLGLACPGVCEHRLRDCKEGWAWLDAPKQRFELAFDLFAVDGLSIAWAATLRAKIIGVALVHAAGPAGCQRRFAIVADDIAAQREILVEVLALGQPVDAVQTILNPLVGLEADDRLMLGLA